MRSTSVRELLLHLAVTELVNVDEDSYDKLSLEQGRASVIRGIDRVQIRTSMFGQYEYDYAEWSAYSREMIRRGLIDYAESLRIRMLLTAVYKAEPLELHDVRFIYATGHEFLVRRCTDHLHVSHAQYRELSAVIDVDVPDVD